MREIDRDKASTSVGGTLRSPGRYDGEGLLDVREPQVTSASPSPSRRRWSPAAVWILPLGLVLLVLGVAAAVWAHEVAVNHHWPERITVNGRNYDNPVPMSSVDVRAEMVVRVQLGTAGPSDYPVYGLGPAIPSTAPTGVVVQTSFNTYVYYALEGGP